jgi:prefoldin subunit 5
LGYTIQDYCIHCKQEHYQVIQELRRSLNHLQESPATLDGDEQNAEDFAEMRVPLGAHFQVFVQFECDQESSC